METGLGPCRAASRWRAFPALLPPTCPPSPATPDLQPPTHHSELQTQQVAPA